MSGPFRVGDVVVCVDAHTPAKLGWAVDPQLVQGKIYRVSEAFCGEWGDCVKLCGIHARTINGGYLASRFRHLPRATDAFTAKIRACKPMRAGEVA